MSQDLWFNLVVKVPQLRWLLFMSLCKSFCDYIGPSSFLNVLGIALSAIYDVATIGLIVVVAVLLLAFVALYMRLDDKPVGASQ